MSYTVAAALGCAFAVLLDLGVLRTRLVTRRAFWTAYLIVLAFQVAVDGVLTGQRLVVYDRHAIVGTRLVYAPVEDLLFGFALVLQTLAWWVWWGRRATRRERQARTSPGTATAARRRPLTRARRSSTS